MIKYNATFLAETYSEAVVKLRNSCAGVGLKIVEMNTSVSPEIQPLISDPNFIFCHRFEFNVLAEENKDNG